MTQYSKVCPRHVPGTVWLWLWNYGSCVVLHWTNVFHLLLMLQGHAVTVFEKHPAGMLLIIYNEVCICLMESLQEVDLSCSVETSWAFIKL